MDLLEVSMTSPGRGRDSSEDVDESTVVDVLSATTFMASMQFGKSSSIASFSCSILLLGPKDDSMVDESLSLSAVGCVLEPLLTDSLDWMIRGGQLRFCSAAR
jgi:hypothetical protein